MSDRVDALVIFGATGDLAKLETFPALVGLVERDVLNVPVIGVSKKGWDLEQFRGYATASLQLNKMDPGTPSAVKMLSLLRYVDGDLDDDATYQAMSDMIGPGEQVLFYMEVPAFLFGRIAQGIATAGRARGARVMVEKPFGADLASSRKLNDTMHQYFDEEAIFRVVSDRGSFYDKTGAIRDVVQNHMLQVLATVMADPPDGEGLSNWRDAKARLIASLTPLSPEHTVRGQYEGYHDVDGVDPHSTVETFVAIRLMSDSWRWADVPILIRAGKCMAVTATEVAVKFRHPPRDIFGLAPLPHRNELRFRVWPETAVTLTLAGKKPGAGWEPQTEELTFAQEPGSDQRPYDRLIGAALDGERWLFARQDTVENAWKIVDPVLGDVTPVHPYAKGSWGPKEADRLLPDRDSWHDPAGDPQG